MKIKLVLVTLMCFISVTLFTVVLSQDTTSQVIRNLYAVFQQASSVGDFKKLLAIEKTADSILQQQNLSKGDLGVVLLISGSIKSTLFHHQQALPLLEKSYGLLKDAYGEHGEKTLESKKYLSWTFGYLGNYDKERNYSFELLNYFRSDSSRYFNEIADTYNTIGMDYGYQLDPVSEQYYLNKSLQILEKAKPKDETTKENVESNLINICNSLAISYNTTHKYNLSLLYARKTLALRNLYMPASPYNAIEYMIIGKCIGQTESNADSAIAYLSKAVDILENKENNKIFAKGDARWVTYKSYKALALLHGGKTDQAVSEMNSVMAAVGNTKNLDFTLAVSLIKACIALSEGYVQLNQYQQALKICRETEAHLSSIKDRGGYLFQFFLTEYGHVLSLNQLWSEAKLRFDSAIALSGVPVEKLLSDGYTLPPQIYYEKLAIYARTGNFLVQYGLQNKNRSYVLDGVRLMTKVARALESQKAAGFSAGIDEAIGLEDFDVYEQLLEGLYQSKGVIDEKRRMAEAFSGIESSKASLLQNNLFEEELMNHKWPEALNRTRRDMKKDVAKAKDAVKANRTDASEAELYAKIDRYQQFLDSCRRAHPLGDVMEKNTISYSDKRLVDHKGDIVNFFLGKKHLYAFIHENAVQKFTRKPVPENFINEFIRLRGNCLQGETWEDSTNKRELKRISREWYSWLLADATASGELVIIPHRQLSLLSFEMLDAGTRADQPEFVLLKRPVKYALSARLLCSSPGKPAAWDQEKGFGGFSASDFEHNSTATSQLRSRGNTQEFTLPNLEGTAREVENIALMTKGMAFKHVTPSQFLENFGKYDLVHIATHALADQGPDHECNLLFEKDAKGNSIVDDYVVATSSINAKMVVLSACNTAVGRMNENEGTLSLGRSFFLAGCPSVVMSLWTVDDEATGNIMNAFYRHLLKGETKSEALRHAKLNYINTQPDEKKKHPFFWAGFVIVGDDAPLKMNAHQSFTPFLVAGLLIVLTGSCIYFLRRRNKLSA